MKSELLCADGFMIIDSLFVGIIDSSQAIKANPAVERTIKIVADELIGLSVLVTCIKSTVHLY
jgi:hypothetical protein